MMEVTKIKPQLSKQFKKAWFLNRLKERFLGVNNNDESTMTQKRMEEKEKETKIKKSESSKDDIKAPRVE